MVASQWKMSSSALGPALQEVGGSFWRSCDAGDSWVMNAMMVSVGRVARARSGRAARARLRARSPSGIFWGAPFFFRAREEKNLEGSKKPYGRGAIAPGATFARARTCSSLVIRLDAIVNLRWLCEKRDSGGRGKPRLVCDRQLSSARETGVEAGGRRGFFFILGTIANSKNVTEEAARDFCVHGFHGFYSHANSQIFRLFPCSR